MTIPDTDGEHLRVVREGERVCCCGRAGTRTAGKYPVWTGKVYEAVPRKRDGLLVWRLVDTFGDTRSGYNPPAKFLAELREAAPRPWLEVTHNQLVMPIAVEGGAP